MTARFIGVHPPAEHRRAGCFQGFHPYEATALLGALGTLGEAVGGHALPKPDQSVLSAAGAARAKVDSLG